MDTITYLCTGCQLRCQLTVTSEAGIVRGVIGNRCKRGLDGAARRLRAQAGEFTLRLKVTGGTAAQVAARAHQQVTADVARAIGLAMRRHSVPAPVNVGDVLVRDAAGLEIDLIAMGDVPARGG